MQTFQSGFQLGVLRCHTAICSLAVWAWSPMVKLVESTGQTDIFQRELDKPVNVTARLSFSEAVNDNGVHDTIPELQCFTQADRITLTGEDS